MRHNKKIKIAVFPIAGMGTRFLPITKTISKEMLNIMDRPLLDYAVEELWGAIGPEEAYDWFKSIAR